MASVSRPLSLRRRADLQSLPVQAAGRTAWNIKDPVAQRFYQLGPEEHWILQQLDGATSLEAIVESFNHRFTPRRLDPLHLHAFLGALHKEGMLTATTSGQGEQLLKLGDQRRRRALLEALTNPWAIRFRGLDLDAWLGRVHERWQALFGYAGLAAYCGLVLTALVLVLTRFEAFQARLPDLATFFHPRNWLLFAAAIALAKVVHELAHGLACKHFGGELHELGVMLLFGVPCLYCNVSDAWMLPLRRQRVLVSAAGMLAEMGLAAAATLIWHATEPSLVNALCLRLMFVCSVSTVLFNGNPLLRYDGYFILSDLVGIANLAQRAAAALHGFFVRLVFGVRLPQESLTPLWQRMLLALYAVASFAYRIAITLGLLWVAYQVLKPLGLEVIAYGLGLAMVIGMTVPIVRSAGSLRQMRQQPTYRKRRAWTGTFIALAVLAAMACIPLPSSIQAPVTLQSRDAQTVFVTTAGTLRSAIKSGTEVAAGDVLAELDDPKLTRELLDLQNQRDRQAAHLQNLQANRIDRDDLEAQIPAAQAYLKNLDERLKKKTRDHAELMIRAPIAGTVLPPRRRELLRREGQPVGWGGTPLDAVNRGALLETGTALCIVGDRDHFEALALVSQGDVDRVKVGQPIEVWLDQFSGVKLTGRVTELSHLQLASAPPELVARGDLAIRGGGERTTADAQPIEAHYQARIKLDAAAEPLLPGAIGTAKIITPSRSLWQRLGGQVLKLLNLDM